MQNTLITLLLFNLLTLFACQHRSVIDNIEQIPEVSDQDKAFSDVYRLLDGTWKGQFNIYEDSQPQMANTLEMKQLSPEALKKEGLKLIKTINVQQVYTSESPFFQRVVITDTDPESGQQEISKGVNKVQNGKLWCVVKKPSETIIHEGSTIGTNTIIWQSDSKDKREYFFETVTENAYEIIGWGYYGDEDRSKSPKLWFYGKYDRIK